LLNKFTETFLSITSSISNIGISLKGHIKILLLFS